MARDSEADDLFSSSEGGATFDPVSFLWTARKFWWIIAACIGAGLVIGLILVKLSKPEYVSTAELKVERRAASSAISLSGGSSVFEGATAPEDLKTIEKSFASPALMRRVAAQLRASNVPNVSFDGYPLEGLSDEAAAGFLMAGCRVALIPDTRLIQVEFKSRNPEVAQKIANLIVNEGIQNDLDQRVAASGSNIRYLRDEVKKFEENLRASEEKLNSYTRTLGNVSIDGDLNIVANQLRELNSRSTTAKAERLRIESDYAQIQACLNDPAKLMKIESIQKLPSIVSLSNQIGEVQNKIAKLSLRYRESNPFMLQARSELAELEAALQREILEAPKNVEAALSSARRAEETILREQALQEEKVIQVRDLSVPSRVLQRQIDADRLAYEAALKRLSEELSQARNQPVLLQVVNPASYGVPGGSKPIKLLGIALFMGTMAGFGIVFLIMQLDSSFKSQEEAERVLGLSVLGAIPEYPFEKQKDNEEPKELTFQEYCPALGDRYSQTAESVRSIRTALRTPDDEETARPLLITSPMEEDGKSFVASNLAIVLAQAGERTLLVDANLRRPVLERMILRTSGRPGLSEFLQREAGLANVIHPTSVPHLDLVPAGAPCAFPAEILSRTRFAEFLAEARPLYDRIIVDSAPVNTVSDTLAFAHLLPLVCVIVRSAKTPRGPAKRSLELLQRAGARPTGMIFNATNSPFTNQLRDLDFSSTRERRAQNGPPGFPMTCPSCGKVYESPQAFLANTGDAAATLQDSALVSRKCSCGYLFSARGEDLRDRTGAGEYRRQVFGELMDRLESTGMTVEEARRHLLLTLKIWRNESPGDLDFESSKAGGARTRMFTEVLDRLVRAGYTPDQARKKVTEAVETWRSTS